jgi:phosphomevalonate kinase
MTHVTTSAPGKIMLSGEYAVLDGAPAICMAVNRRARVMIRTGVGDQQRVSAPGFLEQALEFDSVSEVEHALPLLAAAWRALPVPHDGSLSIEIDTRGFAVNRRKLGAGSSAAATVALVAGLATAFQESHDHDVLQTAQSVHRNLQAGRGSGADIACSFTGGVIAYRKDDGVVRNLAWPEELHYALLWSGQPASTRRQLEKVAAIKQTETALELQRMAEHVLDAWHYHTARNILAAMREYATALRRFDDDLRLGIYSAGHAEVARLADSTDVLYKPCGAGGGDLGIALAHDDEALAGFVASCQRLKFEYVNLEIEPVGVAIERGDA